MKLKKKKCFDSFFLNDRIGHTGSFMTAKGAKRYAEHRDFRGSGGAGGKAATANCRAQLTELLTFIKADVLTEQTGISVPAEAWGTDVLTLTDEQKTQLCTQADALIR